MKEILEKSCSSAGCVRTSEDSPLPEKGREKLAGLLAELLGFPSADRQPEAKANRLNLYESMRPRVGSELPSAPTCAPPSQAPQQHRGAVIYENCFKCQAEHCRPPPRVAPPLMYRSGNLSTLRTSPTAPPLARSREHEAAANEELLHQARSDGSQLVDGLCQRGETNDRTAPGEGKRPLCKASAIPPVSFSSSVLWNGSSLLFFCSVALLIIDKNPLSLLASGSLISSLFSLSLHSVRFPFCCAALTTKLSEGRVEGITAREITSKMHLQSPIETVWGFLRPSLF